MEKILISSCLLGKSTTYKGSHHRIEHGLIGKWQREGRLVYACPEILGGLPTPRPKCEIKGGQGQDVLLNKACVATQNGQLMTHAFAAGAQKTLNIVKRNNIKFALFKANSPSCGNTHVYDGTFTKNLINGIGVTAALLKQHGVQIFNEKQFDQLAKSIEDSA